MGAAIAAGSHALKGTWALLVLVAKIRAHRTKEEEQKASNPARGKEKEEKGKRRENEIRINASPSRFVKAVKTPALKALLLL